MLALPQPVVEVAEQTDVGAANIGLFQDVPGWIWGTFLSAWAMFFGLMAVFFTTGGGAIFAVSIAVFFAGMAFGLPIAMAAQSNCAGYECSASIDTHTGPLSAVQAGVQITLIPVAAVLGLTAFIALAM